LTTSAELSKVIRCFVIISQILGVQGEIWGILPRGANAALDIYREPDHLLQEKHLLRCPW